MNQAGKVLQRKTEWYLPVFILSK